jgi:FKBP-type peptidyl-prolyl cis-trans isomerase FkpA
MTHKTASILATFALSAFAALATQATWAADPPAEPLVKAAAEKGAVVTPSGLVYLSLRDGKGMSPLATDTVRVNYRGTFLDGREFDSSYKRGVPASFPLNRVIPCWTEGVQLMKVGGKAKLTCPSAIAYGERGAGNGEIPPNSILRFEVELLGITGK